MRVWQDGLLPWRLTKSQRMLMDERTKNMLWPHYVERLYYRGASFWIKTSRLGKTARKIQLLLYILPTQLRDQLPAVRVALFEFVWALRRMLGQVYSYQMATTMDPPILPGSRGVRHNIVDKSHGDLIKALVLLEGCLPVSQLNPALHHFVHYGLYTKTHGSLRWYWMMSFERYVTQP